MELPSSFNRKLKTPDLSSINWVL